MAYESDRNKGPEGEPSIAKMTQKAIEVLRKNPRGYFLMVEGNCHYKILSICIKNCHLFLYECTDISNWCHLSMNLKKSQNEHIYHTQWSTGTWGATASNGGYERNRMFGATQREYNQVWTAQNNKYRRHFATLLYLSFIFVYTNFWHLEQTKMNDQYSNMTLSYNAYRGNSVSFHVFCLIECYSYLSNWIIFLIKMQVFKKLWKKCLVQISVW